MVGAGEKGSPVAQPADGKSVANGTAYRALVRMAASFAARRRTLRRQIYEIVEIGRGDDRASRFFDAFIIGLIALNIAAFMAETVPELSAAYGPWFRAFEAFLVAICTIEYGLRIWTAVEMPFLSLMSPLRARLHLATRGYAHNLPPKVIAEGEPCKAMFFVAAGTGPSQRRRARPHVHDWPLLRCRADARWHGLRHHVALPAAQAFREDFHRVEITNPEIAAHIRTTAARRRARRTSTNLLVDRAQGRGGGQM
jgi:hypothetical protein